MQFDVRFASTQDDLALAYALRHQVLEVEQGMLTPILPDSFDPIADHALAIDLSGRCIGTGRAYRLDARTVRVGRQAVLPEARNSGVGTRLLAALEHIANMRGVRETLVHARVGAEDFYLKQGYHVEGDIFDEGGTLRRLLKKSLWH